MSDAAKKQLAAITAIIILSSLGGLAMALVMFYAAWVSADRGVQDRAIKKANTEALESAKCRAESKDPQAQHEEERRIGDAEYSRKFDT